MQRSPRVCSATPPPRLSVSWATGHEGPRREQSANGAEAPAAGAGCTAIHLRTHEGQAVTAASAARTGQRREGRTAGTGGWVAEPSTESTASRRTDDEQHPPARWQARQQSRPQGGPIVSAGDGPQWPQREPAWGEDGLGEDATRRRTKEPQRSAPASVRGCAACVRTSPSMGLEPAPALPLGGVRANIMAGNSLV